MHRSDISTYRIFKPDLTSITLPVNVNEPACSVENYVTDAPSDESLLEKARVVTGIVKESMILLVNPIV